MHGQWSTVKGEHQSGHVPVFLPPCPVAPRPVPSSKVNWTKFSAASTGSTSGTRRDTDDVRIKIRATRSRGTLQLYFCTADEDKVEEEDMTPAGGSGSGGDASGGGGTGGAATPYAEIASILQVMIRELGRWWWWWWWV